MSARVHHSAICAQDFDASLRFYRDGLGLEVMMDSEFDGDWPGLFDAPSSRLHSVFLGDPAMPDAGIVELVAFVDADLELRERTDSPEAGFFLLSFFVGDVDETLERLRGLGFGDDVRRIEVGGPHGDVPMATLRDADGVLVELIGAG
jgi:glyoxylase I family protein